ncbi:hypothetical protein V496_01349 [Pseudogymnoascus sp. VKM F-4515 (FW-2607)]|nr:hypothetical protein V496_01349 [Pseudogymnoascus sp. VKM F-4515 (FW-2607)]KFY94755.1 hypothetical protein V498_03741 [Pseudogymnoascus sp. VKM F-4517 (FW-2822)]
MNASQNHNNNITLLNPESSLWFTMASGLVDLATFALQASVTLYKTVESFNSHQERVRDFAREASALSGVLGSLTETITSTDLDLTALEVPLRRCGKACEEFEQEIHKCSQRSGGSRASFRDWARLRYMGDDIDSFRRVLSGYKMTITIALSDANLRLSALTAESVESYNDLLGTAKAGLEDHLERMDEKLERILSQNVAGSELDASEAKRIKDERLSTEKCLQICSQLSEHIDQIQRTTLHNTSADAADCSSSIPEKITNDGLKECKGSLARMAQQLASHEKQLFNRLMDKLDPATFSQENAADITRLREEWQSTRKSMDILSTAGNHLEQNISIIENHATGDAVQVMVSANGKTLHGTNRAIGWRSRQIGGYLDNETVRQISRDMVSITINTTNEREPRLGGETETVSDDREREGRDSQFMERRMHKRA